MILLKDQQVIFENEMVRKMFKQEEHNVSWPIAQSKLIY